MARKSSKQIWWITGGVVVLLIGGLFGAKQAGYIGKPKTTEVEYAIVKKSDIIERVSASGKVQPEVEVKLSPDVSGEIIALNVAEGDSVVKGQLLLKIRPDNYESLMARAQAAVNSSKANYEQTKAMVAQAEARLVQAKANYDRNKKLFADKVISSADFEQFASSYGVAQQDVESSKANVAAALFNIKSAEASAAGVRSGAPLMMSTKKNQTATTTAPMTPVTMPRDTTAGRWSAGIPSGRGSCAARCR